MKHVNKLRTPLADANEAAQRAIQTVEIQTQKVRILTDKIGDLDDLTRRLRDIRDGYVDVNRASQQDVARWAA